MPIRIAIIGYGKIAKDQHVPAILANADYALVAAASPRAREASIPVYKTHVELIDGLAGQLDAVAICTPATVRYEAAAYALRAGLAVLLEKPPTVTLGELERLRRSAEHARLSLFTAWHSQHNEAVGAAARALEGRVIRSLAVEWREDVEKWHPGQRWIWEPGGFGVFDPGINALAILSRILPEPLLVRDATFSVQRGRQMPIAARLTFGDGQYAEMDWRHAHEECWTITLEAEGRHVQLRDGGARLLVDGEERVVGGSEEYPSIYRRFAELIRSGSSEVDGEPLRIAADAFLRARREMIVQPSGTGDAVPASNNACCRLSSSASGA
jgi:D-galactose 1-dehydrogenase